MTPIRSAVDLFEGESKKILYLPPIILGYIFTLSSSFLDFGLAVFSIGGARMFSDIIQRAAEEQSNNGGPWQDVVMDDVLGDHSLLAHVTYMIVSVFFFVAILWSAFQLYSHFNYQDPVIVSFSAIYWGISLVIFMNIIK